MNLIPSDTHSAAEAIPPTTTNSLPSSKPSSPPKGILKGNSQNHTVSPTSSEIDPKKKRVSWRPNLVDGDGSQRKKEMDQAKAKILSFAEDIERAEHHLGSQPPQKFDDSYSKDSNEDIVSVPGVGDVDRKRYDIGKVEYHDDGTYTVTDMTGRRFDYPVKQPPSDSCTIS